MRRFRPVRSIPAATRRPMVAAALGLVAGTVAAQPAAPAIDTGDTAWMLVSAALVLLMTPGLALFYGGLVRGKNVLGTMMQSLAAMALVGVLWVVCGYTIAFGSDLGHVVGAFDYLLLRGVGGDPLDGQSIPHLLFVAFQGMFAIITPALIGGAVAERMKFKAFLLFMLLWVLLVYAPLAHWVWGSGGWLLELGALDFAGGTVVHISSGFSALIACLMLGRRRGFPGEPILPHNLPLVILGAGLLWFGWFGFNAGSALAANGTAALALVTTHVSAAAGALAWLLYDWIKHGRPTALGTVSGAVAGLVGITPAAGFVSPAAAIALGAVTSLGCVTFVTWRTRRGIDDSLDAFGIHGVGGTIGALLTGVFASHNAAGLLTGDARQFGIQIVGVVATYVYVGIVTFILLKVLQGAVGLRVTVEEEMIGLDQTQHGEAGYSM
ncbi:MAG: Ammonium transporter NrgA [candidate division BRC1 bacterium ADurb.BinA292]|nr:MAG: Ammonium transporter NrgA [candidate division BRC1 bacterium ADurb.BinA292]